MKNCLPYIGLSLACFFAGCTELPRTTPTEDAVRRGAVVDAVTYLNLEALQGGVGEMDADAPTEFQTTQCGMQYRILRNSEWQKPNAKDSVTVHYRGWLDNGREFDSSYGKPPFSTSLQRVVPGWTEGIQLVGTGGMIELWIPAKLGYGVRGSGGSIPPNSPLHFIVELESID